MKITKRQSNYQKIKNRAIRSVVKERGKLRKHYFVYSKLSCYALFSINGGGSVICTRTGATNGAKGRKYINYIIMGQDNFRVTTGRSAECSVRKNISANDLRSSRPLLQKAVNDYQPDKLEKNIVKQIKTNILPFFG